MWAVLSDQYGIGQGGHEGPCDVQVNHMLGVCVCVGGGVCGYALRESNIQFYVLLLKEFSLLFPITEFKIYQITLYEQRDDT